MAEQLARGTFLRGFHTKMPHSSFLGVCFGLRGLRQANGLNRNPLHRRHQPMSHFLHLGGLHTSTQTSIRSRQKVSSPPGLRRWLSGSLCEWASDVFSALGAKLQARRLRSRPDTQRCMLICHPRSFACVQRPCRCNASTAAS